MPTEDESKGLTPTPIEVASSLIRPRERRDSIDSLPEFRRRGSINSEAGSSPLESTDNDDNRSIRSDNAADNDDDKLSTTSTNAADNDSRSIISTDNQEQDNDFPKHVTVAKLKLRGYKSEKHIEQEDKDGRKSVSDTIPLNQIRGYKYGKSGQSEDLLLEESGFITAIYHGNEGFNILSQDLEILRKNKLPKNSFNSMAVKIENTSLSPNKSHNAYCIISNYSDNEGHNYVSQSFINEEEYEERKRKAQSEYTRLLDEEIKRKAYHNQSSTDLPELSEDEKEKLRHTNYNLSFIGLAQGNQDQYDRNKAINDRLHNKLNDKSSNQTPVIDKLAQERFAGKKPNSETLKNFKEKLSTPITAGPGSVTISHRESNNSHKVDVLFSGGAEADYNLAWIHIPGSKNLYVKAQVCHRDGEEIQNYENGKAVTKKFNRGDVIIHQGTAFKATTDAAGQPQYNAIEASQMSYNDNESFKKLDIRVISGLDRSQDKSGDLAVDKIGIATMDKGVVIGNSLGSKVSEERKEVMTRNPNAIVKKPKGQALQPQQQNQNTR